MRKILVLRGGALGDFIVTLPALARLREHWPAAWIEWVGNARAAQLARNRGLLDQVHSQHEARWSALFGAAPLPSSLASWLAEFDLVLNYWPDPDGALQRKFPLREGQTFLAEAAMPSHAPAAAHYCAPLRRLGIEPGACHHVLSPLDGTDAVGVASGQRLTVASPACVAIHPGSGSIRKNWPAERWLELIRTLPGPVLLILGEAELERWGPIASTGVADNVRLAVDLPLETLVTQLNGCRLFLGHDSGVSHLAAACGIPAVLLFGPTDPVMWAPPTPGVRVLHRGPTLETISVADVSREVAAVLAVRT